MKVLCFSSFSFSYLNRARVLFATLRQHNPDWHLVALITDRPPDGFAFDVEAEVFDEVVYSSELGIPDYEPWLFGHDVVEACTAVKGPFLREACLRDVDVVIYLDPDIAVFDSLSPVVERLRDADVLLTPHSLEPGTELASIIDNEIGPLKAGIYNLGFVGVRTSGDGLRFSSWWRDRLIDFCYDVPEDGLFVDQRWCDHVPVFFPRVHIVRDPGCNVASWNLNRRTVSIGHDGTITVNGSPLRFWHFTKLGHVADVMTRRHAKDNFEVYEIWNWYKRRVIAATDPLVPDRYWAFAAYEDGTPIFREHRLLYRTRRDLRERYPHPFQAGPKTFSAWVSRQATAGRGEREAFA